MPLITEPQYQKFKKAIDLINKEACYVVKDSQKLSVLLNGFFTENPKVKMRRITQ